MAEFLAEGFNPETARRYVIDQLGVSSDIGVLSSVDMLQTLGVALTERNTGLGVDPTSAHIQAVYHQHLADGTLPAHLQTQQAFKKRYHALVGHPDEVFARNEIIDSVAAHRDHAPREIQSVFEREVAKTLAPFVHKMISMQPSLMEDIMYSITFYSERTQRGNFMRSGNGLREKLPTKHAGVIQGAPTFKDTIARWSEIGPGTWDNIALLSSTYFNEEFSRLVGPQLFNKSEKRVFATHKGLAKGAEELQRKMTRNKKLKQGFGAMILSDVRHRSIEEVCAAIDVAPFLLAKNGLLIISELDHFPDGRGSVFDLMKRARKVFGSDAHSSVGLMTLDHGQEGSGRQATFIKT